MMKKYIVFIVGVMCAVLMDSCQDETEILMNDEEDVFYLSAAYADEMRGLRPVPTEGKPQTADNNHAGEKGRDRRDWYDSDSYKFERISALIKLRNREVYVLSHNEDNDECFLSYYCGATEKDRAWLVSLNVELELAFYDSHYQKLFVSERKPYRSGDVIKIPHEVCKNCTMISVMEIHGGGQAHVWQQYFQSHHTDD